LINGGENMRSIRVGNAVFRVMYAGVSPFIDHFKTQIYFENLTIGQIASVLDGNAGILYENGDSQETFEGYSRLIKIEFVDNETVVAILERVKG
jgi:hypothetical protein